MSFTNVKNLTTFGLKPIEDIVREILVIGLFGHFEKYAFLSFPSVFKSPN